MIIKRRANELRVLERNSPEAFKMIPWGQRYLEDFGDMYEVVRQVRHVAEIKSAAEELDEVLRHFAEAGELPGTEDGDADAH